MFVGYKFESYSPRQCRAIRYFINIAYIAGKTNSIEENLTSKYKKLLSFRHEEVII